MIYSQGQAILLDYDEPSSLPTIGTAVASLLTLILVVQLLLKYLDGPLLSFAEASWNAFVYVMPASLVYGLRSSSATTARSHRTSSQSVQHAEKSEILRNAFGIRTGAHGRGKRTYTTAPKGLGNFDNSCYQNSVLQALASVPSVRLYLQQIALDSRAEGQASTVEALQDLVTNLNDVEDESSYFWTPALLKSMSSWQQQDAQEYFSKLLDAIEKDVRDVRRRQRVDDTPDLSVLGLAAADKGRSQDYLARIEQGLAHPLEGLQAQRVGCTACGHCEGISLIPFNCLTLPLGRSGPTSLENCLDAATDLEYIEGVECANCSLLDAKHQLEMLLKTMENSTDSQPARSEDEGENRRQALKQRLDNIDTALSDNDFSETTLKDKCLITSKLRKSSTKSKQVALLRAPQCLVMHVNRSIFDEYTGDQLKNHSPLTFPATFQPDAWIIGSSSESHTAGPEQPELETWTTDPRQSMLGPDNLTQKKDALQYALKAVVTHSGRHENGHYICYRQSPRVSEDGPSISGDSDLSEDSDAADHPDANQWWRISDETVYPVGLEGVLAQPESFLLFYERINGVAQDETLVETTTPAETSVSDQDVDNAPDQTLVSLASKTEPTRPVNAATVDCGEQGTLSQQQISISDEDSGSGTDDSGKSSATSEDSEDQLQHESPSRMKTATVSSSEHIRPEHVSHTMVAPI